MKTAIISAILALALPGSAMAATQYYIPPGNSSANEYVESIPTAGGSSSTGISGQGPGSSFSGHRAALAPSTTSALIRQGQAGAQTAAFADATAPGAKETSQGAADARRRSQYFGGQGASASGGSPPAATVARSLTGVGGPDGSSRALVAVLILVVLAVAAIALRRRRTE